MVTGTKMLDEIFESPQYGLSLPVTLEVYGCGHMACRIKVEAGMARKGNRLAGLCSIPVQSGIKVEGALSIVQRIIDVISVSSGRE